MNLFGLPPIWMAPMAGEAASAALVAAVSAGGGFGQLGAAYPDKVDDANRTPITMMLFGMMNWTFTWLKPDGPLSYEGYAEMVIEMLEKDLKTTVLSSIPAQVWATKKILHLNEPVSGYGRLLAEMP